MDAEFECNNRDTTMGISMEEEYSTDSEYYT